MDYVKEKAFDAHNEGIDVRNLPKGRHYNVISLFSGCGGLDLGFQGNFSCFKNENQIHFEKNPFDVIWANDFYKEACESYAHYFEHEIIHGDITKIDKHDIPKGDIVIGGFPCQDFSISGKQGGLQTARGNLYLQMKETIRIQKPVAFLAENVKNILSPKLTDENGKRAIERICEDFENLGYNVTYNLVYAPDYGIPQKRWRVFIVGIRKDLKRHFIMPKAHHPAMNAKQAIDDLWGKEQDTSIFNHDQMSLAKFKPPKRNGNQGNYQVHADQPSQTIRSEHHMNIQAHYRTLKPEEPDNRDYWRRLTVRECARLQTFPDDFWFAGSKSAAYRVVGNAVPPMLGWYMARALYCALESPLNKD